MSENSKRNWLRDWLREHTHIIAMVIIAGLAIIARFCTKEYLAEGESRNFVFQLLDAVLIACVLGSTIDIWLKRQIAEDVFRASIGHLLPDSLKSAIRWVYGFDLLCEQHVHNITIERIPDLEGFVAITATIERKIRNISSKKLPFAAAVTTDEWNVPNYPSEIIECGYQYGDKIETNFVRINKAHKKIRAEFSEIDLKSDETIKVWYKTKEIKRTTDMLIWTFSYPTHNPVVTVSSPDDFEVSAGFTTHDGNQWQKDRFEHTYRLNSTLLPTQYIEVKWWPKETETLLATNTNQQ